MARNWAITIGINHYRYLQPLRYGMSDANAVRHLFCEELKFCQVYHFTDQSSPIPQDYGPDLVSQPTSTTLGRFLRRRFKRPFLKTGDNLWFFFAGHGIRHENRDYLMPIDGDREDLERSAIPLHYVSERLCRSGADNVIMLIDACRNGEGRRDSYSFGEEKQQGVITLYSCSPEEASYEMEEIGGGAFTHVLLESLRLQGEGNCATVERLYQRLRYHVPALTRNYRRDVQTPYGRIEPPNKSHLILLPQQATLTDVIALKNDALKSEVKRDVETARHLWIRVLMLLPGDLDAVPRDRRSMPSTASRSPGNNISTRIHR
ncbi:MAG: caspase family protein [Cyanobacteria bacterium J06576_12]